MKTQMLVALRAIYGNRTLRGASLGVFANGASFAAVMPYQSMVGINVLALNPTGYAFVVFLSSLFAVVISVSIGIATDRGIDRWNIMAAALLVGIVGNGIVALAPRVEIFVVAHLFMIPVSVGIYGQFFSMIRVETSRGDANIAASVSSIIRALFSLAWMMAPVAASALIQAGYPIVTVYAFASSSCLIGLLALLSVPKPVKTIHGEANKSTKGIMLDLGRPDVLTRLVLIGVVIGCPRLASMILGLVIVDRSLGTQVDVGIFAGIMAFLEIPFILAAGIGLRYLSRVKLIFAGTAMFSLFLVGLAGAPNLVMLYALSIPGAFGAAVLGSLTIGYLQDLVPERPGSGGSLISVGSFIGSLVSSAVFAIGVDTVGYTGTALLGATLGVGAAILLVVQQRVLEAGQHPIEVDQ